MLGYGAILALPSVILILLFGQTRIFFVMARDGLLPEKLAEVHPKWKTPHIVTAITGVVVAIAAAFLPVGQLADIANAGTLYAFLMVAMAVMMLRKRDPDRKRAFRVPALSIIGPLTIARLPVPVLQPADGGDAGAADLDGDRALIYFGYSRRHSHLGQGIVEVPRGRSRRPAPRMSRGSTIPSTSTDAEHWSTNRKGGRLPGRPFFALGSEPSRSPASAFKSASGRAP